MNTQTRGKSHSDGVWLPRVAALVTALMGAVNVLTALLPDMHWARYLLLHVESPGSLRLFHALELPAGAALLILSPYLLGRRRRAMRAATVLLVLLGIVNILKGLDVAESVLGWMVAALLYRGRAAFTVQHAPITLRSGVLRVPLVAAVAVGVISLADWVARGHRGLRAILGESSALLRFKRGSVPYGVHHARAFDHTVTFAWIPLEVHMIEASAILAIVFLIFKPLAIPKGWASATQHRRAVQLVRRHGQDTLAFFKLRPDGHIYFNEDRTAFVGYRVEAGTMLLSGDPVGPPETLAELLLGVRRFARERGLKLAAIGASPALLPFYEGLGLRSLYLGDEAVVEMDGFSLEGRPIRKVRQSVNRLQKAGYAAEVRKLAELDEQTLAEIEHVMEVGRIGGAERGFSMGMDGIRGACEQDTVFVLARDREGAVRGMLHFVPCYGRPAVSLSLMRRDPTSPNGLMEFLVVAAIERLREDGIGEMSLNFAALTKFLRDPEGRVERVLGRIASVLNPYFQIESLYRFNVKFFPRWDPRYLVYEGRFGIPRTALAAIWAEGQLPKLSSPGLRLKARLGVGSATDVAAEAGSPSDLVGQRALKTANR